MICKILGLSVDALHTDDDYSVLNGDNLAESIQIKLSKKRKPFSQFILRVLKSRSNLNILTKQMTLMADVFPKLGTAKDVVRDICKRSRL